MHPLHLFHTTPASELRGANLNCAREVRRARRIHPDYALGQCRRGRRGSGHILLRVPGQVARSGESLDLRVHTGVLRALHEEFDEGVVGRGLESREGDVAQAQVNFGGCSRSHSSVWQTA